MSRQTQTPGTALHAAAGRHLGTREWPGARHNSVVLKYFRDASMPMVDDETPWCAAFVGAVLAECVLAGTGYLAARSACTRFCATGGSARHWILSRASGSARSMRSSPNCAPTGRRSPVGRSTIRPPAHGSGCTGLCAPRRRPRKPQKSRKPPGPMGPKNPLGPKNGRPGNDRDRRGDQGAHRRPTALMLTLIVQNHANGARSRTSGEYLFVILLMMLHPTQVLEPPANTARFTEAQTDYLKSSKGLSVRRDQATSKCRLIKPSPTFGHSSRLGCLFDGFRKFSIPLMCNPIDVIVLVSKQLRMIDAIVMALRNIQHIISSEAVSTDI